MKFYEASASIRATPDRIWALLTDAPHYTDWNTTVDHVEGKIAPGHLYPLNQADAPAPPEGWNKPKQ